MVKKYGMSEKVGFRVHKDRVEYGDDDGSYSSSTKELIDSEVKRLLQVIFFFFNFIITGMNN